MKFTYIGGIKNDKCNIWLEFDKNWVVILRLKTTAIYRVGDQSTNIVTVVHTDCQPRG